MRQYGQIIVFNSLHPHIFSWGQRFFTGQPYTHVSMVVPPVLGVESYYGAQELSVIQPISRFEHDEKMLYQMYMPQGWTDEQISNALRRSYERFAAESYGYFQILWFIFRWLMKKWPFKKDIRRWHNFFPDHPICSEIGWWYLWYLYEEKPELIELRDKLNEWRPDTFHAGDMFTLLSSFPVLFKLTEERWYGRK